MSTNIDRSLDDIIKEQKKLKKKTQKLKTQQTQKKVAQKQQGKQQTKGAAANQKQRKRIGGKQNGQSVQQRQGTQGRRRPIAGKQRAPQKQATQGQRRAIGVKSQGRSGRGNQSIKRNTISRDKGRFVGAKVTANRLKNKLGSLQRSKQIISKAKQLQQNNRLKNRQNRQTQQRDARQNIINNRRGMQGPLKGNRQNKNKPQNARNMSNRNLGTPKLQRRNRFTRTPQWEHVTNQLNNNQANRRRWRGGARRAGGNPSIMGPTEDLRISVPNNLHRPAALKPLFYSNYDLPVNFSAPRKTFATLNERFSNMSQPQNVRTIVVD